MWPVIKLEMFKIHILRDILDKCVLNVNHKENDAKSWKANFRGEKKLNKISFCLQRCLQSNRREKGQYIINTRK